MRIFTWMGGLALAFAPLQQAAAWDLVKTYWQGTDEYSQDGYRLYFSTVEKDGGQAGQHGYFRITGWFRSGFDDYPCRRGQNYFTGFYNENTGTLGFTVLWQQMYKPENSDHCNTVTSYAGAIDSSQKLRLRSINADTYADRPYPIDGWSIAFTRIFDAQGYAETDPAPLEE